MTTISKNPYTGSIKSIVGEDYHCHYGKENFPISYENKTVLDLGAWWGDSSEYFIVQGAKLVIAVDQGAMSGNINNYICLEENSKNFEGKMIPILVDINSSLQIETLIEKYKPDIVKSDIEGAESNLFAIKDEIWNLVPEYIVECHCTGLHEQMLEKCKKNNYEIIKDLPIFNNMIYAIKSGSKS